MNQIKIIIEKYPDGFTGYPLGFKKGAIVGQGDTYEQALEDTKSAINTFVDYYGIDKFLSHFDTEYPILEAYVTETGI
jgi:hypothetical protein